jgi:hypothetical protein
MKPPRRKRSERQRPAAKAVEAAPARRLPEIPATIALAHPTSVEFLAAYNSYFDAYPRWLDAPPLSAACWRERVVEGLLV